MVKTVNYEHLGTDLISLSRVVQELRERPENSTLSLALNVLNVKGTGVNGFHLHSAKLGGGAEEWVGLQVLFNRCRMRTTGATFSKD